MLRIPGPFESAARAGLQAPEFNNFWHKVATGKMMLINQRRDVDRIELIERTLFALQAGQPLPREIARAWERGLKFYLANPGSRLEDLMGFGNAPGKRGLWTELAMRRRDQILARFYQEYFCPQSPRAAAEIISNELAQRTGDLHRRAQPDIRDRAFDHLFDRLTELGLPLPGTLRLYRLLHRLTSN